MTADHPLAKGEVGRVGVPICHLGDMRTLFDGIPLGTMNTSMTINATAAWLLALYVALADDQGAPRAALQGTTQNEIIKEYLSRGTYVFPPAPSMRLTTDVILFTTGEMPKWNPMNVCSYHLQEAGATQELAQIEQMGGTIAAVESGYLKQQLVESNARRIEAIERAEQTVVGVNRFVETEPSPLAEAVEAVVTVSPHAETDQVARLAARRSARDTGAVAAALQALRKAASSGANIIPASIACAKAGVTTGEWGLALRRAFGECRAPTGVGTAMRNDAEGLDDVRAEVDRVSKKLGRRLTLLVGKPGLDGHSNGAEQIASRARDAGMAVVYDGIRLTPEGIAAAAADKRAHIVGPLILSGSHLALAADIIARLKEAGTKDVPVVAGGIIPPQDAAALKQAGVAGVYTPKDFELNRIMGDLCRIVENSTAGADAAE